MVKNNYATNDDVKVLGNKLNATKDDIRRLEKKLDKMSKDNLDMKLEILKELKDMREESDTHQYSHIRINDEITDHESRLKIIETA